MKAYQKSLVAPHLSVNRNSPLTTIFHLKPSLLNIYSAYRQNQHFATLSAKYVIIRIIAFQSCSFRAMLAVMKSHQTQSRPEAFSSYPIPLHEVRARSHTDQFDALPAGSDTHQTSVGSSIIAVDFSRRSGPQKGPGFSPNEQASDPAAHRERLAFLEHVCGVLIESRSGRPPVASWDVFDGPVEDAFDNVPVYDLMAELAFDLMQKGGFIPSFVLGRAGFVPGFSSSIAPGLSLGSGHPSDPRSRLDAGDNAFGTRGYFNNHGPPNDPAALLGRAFLSPQRGRRKLAPGVSLELANATSFRSPRQRATHVWDAHRWIFEKLFGTRFPCSSSGSGKISGTETWGSASLHPRL